ncbi:amidase signature domain-containing protein [Ilyonectria sp. MPI-CAGE-AT-0026]|nr:amidase signature domain-containing protein [Ilyonectria sp. MPI-CAGE-AT-0026]
MSPSSKNVFEGEENRCAGLIQQARQRRDDSISSIKPALPDLPADLPLNVTGIPRELLEAHEVEITEKPAEELVKLLAEGKLSALEVTRSFLRRAALAQRLVNCVTELLPSSALERAEFLDRYYKDNGKTIGPLHGLPISVKEHIGMKGWEVNFSFVARLNEISSTDSLAVKAMYDAGAIPFARSTQPQTLMQLETSSSIYGETVNPYNTSLTPGGSSGGESALIALKGSVLGFGSDTGGSIRVPAGHTGIYGLKPTSTRLTHAGLCGIVGGREQIPSTIGPMSTSIGGLEMLMKVVISSKAWALDPSIPPVEWRDNVDWLEKPNGSRKLRVGVMWDDGIVTPHPPVRRALRTIVDRLRQHDDVEVVDWKPFDMAEAHQIWSTLLFSDNGEVMLDLLDRAKEELRPLTEWALKQNPYMAKRSLDEVWDWTARRDAFRALFAQMWNETGTANSQAIDVLLSPLYVGAAARLGESKYWNYSLLWNVLDYPGVSFPVTTVEPDLDPADHHFQPKRDEDLSIHNLYRPEWYTDAPVSLQLVARRFEDEKLLQALRFIEERIKDV